MSLLKYINKQYNHEYDLSNLIHYCVKGIENSVYDYGSFGVNHLNEESIINSMMHTKKLFIKKEGNQLYHFIISIHPKNGMPLHLRLTYARLILNDVGLKIEKTGFQNIGTIHVGTVENIFNNGIMEYEDNVHIHFIINSVSFIDGHKMVAFYNLLNSIQMFLKNEYPNLNWNR